MKINAKQNLAIYNFAYFLGTFLVFFVLFKASVSAIIFPFAFGFLFAVCWCNEKPITLSLAYIFAGAIINFSLTGFLINLITCVVMLFFYYLHKKLKRPIKQWLLMCYALLSQIGFMVFSYNAGIKVLNIVLTVFIGILFMLCSVNFLKAVLKNKSFKLTIDQKICGFVLLMILGAGLSTLTLFNVEVVKIFATFVILIFCYIFGAVGVVSGAVVGLGVALGTGNTTYIASFAILALFAVCFQNKSRYFSCFAVLLADVVNGLYLKFVVDYNIFSILSVAFGVILFLLISQNSLDLIKKLCNSSKGALATRAIVNRNREGLCNRMYQLSEVFFEMDNNFKNMVKGILPVEEAKTMVLQEVADKVCGDCENRNRCFRTLSEETNTILNNLLSTGFQRGKVSILDVPSTLTSRCTKMNLLLSSTNQLLASYKQYATMVNNLDTSRYLLGEQMGGVAKLLKNLAEETSQNISFDTNLEDEIIDELKYLNINCQEAIIYEQNGKDVNVNLILSEGDSINAQLEKTISKILKKNVVIAKTSNLENTGLVLVNLQTAPNFDVIYGCSGSAKLGSAISGDTYSFVKINQNKVLMAICDGMGSGREAQKISEQAINMIENFYKAGFDNEIVLNSSNKLLTLNSEDIFSALDICIIDLKDGSCDFIKVGASEGLVKNANNNLQTISSSSLPLGILEEIKPNISKILLEDKDIILMFSDGVLDNFGGIENIKNFVLTLKTTNPQTISEEILNELLKITKNNLSDDCTILVSRIFKIV